MKLQISMVNRSENYRIYDDVLDLDPIPRNRWDYLDIGKVFRDLMDEYGRCSSKMYRDTDDGVIQIGWVFEKRVKYDDVDSKETYLQETWVALLDKDETIQVREYHVLGRG